MGGTATLIVRRSRFDMGAFAKLAVLVDGRMRRLLSCGLSSRIEVEPGPHRIRTKMLSCRSNELAVDLAPEETVEVLCDHHALALLLLPMFVPGWGMRVRVTGTSPSTPPARPASGSPAPPAPPPPDRG